MLLDTRKSDTWLVLGLACLVTALGGTVAAADDALKLDMGTAASPVWPGCMRVTKETAYTPQRGYGWQTKAKLLDCHRVAVDRNGTLAIPDDLWGDFVLSFGASAFRADLPNGKYEVVLLIGDVGSVYGPYTTKVRSLYPSRSIMVRANSAEVVREIIDESNILDVYYRNENTEYRKGDCPWRKYIDSKLQPRSFRVEVTDGKLLLEFSPDCRVAGAFVHPAGASDAFTEWYQAQEPARRKFFLDRYHEVKHLPAHPPIDPTPAERARGYVLFSRSYLDDVFPNSVPASDERRIEFDLFAGRGEAESLTFSVVPFRALSGVRVTVSDLAGPDGARIPASRWDVRHVRYLQVPRHAVSDRENPYSVKGRLLDKRESKDFEAGTTRRMWLTVRVPPDSPAGPYTGKITLAPRDAPATVLPVKLRVLPFSLADPSDVAIGIFYSPASPWQYFAGKQDLYWQDVRSSLKLLRDHQFTSVSYQIGRPRVWVDDKDGKIKADLSVFDRFFKVFKEAGMNAKAPFCTYGNDGGSNLIRVQPTYGMGWIERNGERADEYMAPEWITQFRELLRLQADHGKKNGWPPVVYCVHDEVHGWSRKRLEGTAKILQATYMREPDVKTTGCINSSEGLMLVPYHDYPMFNSGVPFNEENLELVRKHGKTVTIDNFGQNRWSIGFWMWRIQPKLVADSFFCWVGADPYNPFDDATASELAVALPGRNGWVPTPTLPRMREGIDDYRYAHTLRERLREAERKQADPAAIGNARKTLAYLEQLVDVRLRRYFDEGLPSVEACDAVRWRVARAIAALQGDSLPPRRTSDPDAKWWDDAWRRRLALDVSAGLYTRRDVTAAVDLDPADLQRKAGLSKVDPATFRLVGADADQELVPFAFHRGPDGAGRLVWRVSGVTRAMTARRFYLYFGEAGPARPPRPDELVLKRAGPPPLVNLLSNPGFERIEPGTRDPATWGRPDPSRVSKGDFIGTTTKQQKSGRRSLRIVQRGTVEKGKVPVMATHPTVAVLPGRRYRLSGWIKRAKGSSYNEIMLWWQGDKKQGLGNLKFDAFTKGAHDWKHAERTATAPQNAHFAEVHLSIHPSTAPGTAYFDDIRLVLLPKDGHPIPNVVTGQIERAQ